MEKIRILYLITDLGKGGAERYLVDLCSELQKRQDVEFVIGSLLANNQYTEQTIPFTVVNLHFTPFSLRGKNENVAYKTLLETFKPHIVHTHRFLAEFLSSYYVNPEMIYVCHGHDNMEQLRNFSGKTLLHKKHLLEFLEKMRLVRKKYRRANTYFIANSRDTKAYFEQVLPKGLRKNIRLIYCGFHFSFFANDQPRSVRKGQPLKLLNVGSFQEKKNQVFVVAVAKELRKRNIPFEINLLGQGARFETVKKAVAENGLEEHVFLRGMVNHVENWYRAADLYLHVAKYEPFGMVFLEAMASGLPVITLDGKGNRDLIADGKTGFIHPDEDPVAFADSIERLLQDPSLYHSLSSEGKRLAASFDVSLKTAELVDFYRSVLGR